MLSLCREAQRQFFMFVLQLQLKHQLQVPVISLNVPLAKDCYMFPFLLCLIRR